MRFIQEALQIVARHCKVAGLIRHCSSSKSGKVSVTSLMLRHPRRKYWDRSFVPSFCCMSPQVCSFSLTPQQPPSQIYFPLSQQNIFLPLSPPPIAHKNCQKLISENVYLISVQLTMEFWCSSVAEPKLFIFGSGSTFSHILAPAPALAILYIAS